MKQNAIISKVSKININGDGSKFFCNDGSYKNGTNAISINGITVNDSTRANGTTLIYNSSTGTYENASINITGTVGSTIITNAGDSVSIASGAEETFYHTTSEKIFVSVEEYVTGSSITDTSIDFSDNNKYTLQDKDKILVGGNKAQLDIYTKLLMHMDTSSFIDECGNTIYTNTATYDSVNKYFGNGSAYFNNTSIKIASPVGLNFGTGDFTLSLMEKSATTTQSTSYPTLLRNNISSNTWGSGSIGLCHSNTSALNKISLWVYDANSSSAILTSTSLTNNTNWRQITISRQNGLLKLFINGNLESSYTYAGNMNFGYNGLEIGSYTVSNGNGFNGNIDELIISNIARKTSNFSLPTQSFYPYLIANVPTYLKTTGLSDYSLTTIDTITSLTIPVTLPSVNTTCKCLVSFDNQANWLYHDVGGWHKYIGDLTVTWTNSNLNTDLQTYFSNLSITQLTTDLSSLGITPISLDIAFQLNTTDVTQTPSVSAITMNYITKGHTEFATIGRYDESVSFGVKIISSSQLGVKNLTNKSRSININIVTSGS